MNKDDRQESYLEDKNEKLKSEERSERPFKRAERERVDRPESAIRQPREPRKTEDADENFMSRRLKKTEPPLVRNGRQSDAVDHITPKATGKALEPEWMLGDASIKSDQDQPGGKTLDDFERWKRSMKKNDGSGDVGLPSLTEKAVPSVSTSESLNTGEPLKDVRPPPGFEGAAATDGPDAALLNNLFASVSASEKQRERETSVLPPGFSATGPSSTQAAASSAKLSGSSKFSKFFNQNQQSSNTSPEVASGVRSTTQNVLHSSAMDRPSASMKPGGSKDDAEGFERILAMLSSSSVSIQQSGAEPRQSGSTQQQPQAAFPFLTDDYRTPSQHLDSQPNRGLAETSLNQQHVVARDNKSSQSLRGSIYGQSGRAVPGSSSFEHSHEQLSRSPEHAIMPVMRDSFTNGSIMSKHTQNQDFFSSLLNQSQESHAAFPYASPPSDRYNGPRDPFANLGSHSPPSQRFSPPPSRAQYDLRDIQAARSAYGVRSSEEEYHQFMRQQQGQYPQQAPSKQAPRDAPDHDLLNQLMQEQRMGGPREAEQHQATLNSHHGSQNSAVHQGFVTGVGSRPGPGWNGQYEIDPRIPNASLQYRH